MWNSNTFQTRQLRLAVSNFAVLITVWAGLFQFSGCQSIEEPKSFDFTLPATEMNEGAVALQVAVVQVDTDQQDVLEQFWARLDAMKLPLSARQVADKNGLRYAIMSPQCPAILDQLLQRRTLDTSGLTKIQKQMAASGLLESPSPLIHHQRIENDTGETFEIPVSEFYPTQSWFILDRQGRKEAGNGELVRAFMQMSTFPQGDGSVRLVVEPEIHHGRPQQRFDVSQRTFLFSESQIQSRVDALKFSLDLRPGESLVIAQVPEAKSKISGSTNRHNAAPPVLRPLPIGELFFGQSALLAAVETASPSVQQSAQNRLIESAFAELDKQFGSSGDDGPKDDQEESSTEHSEPAAPLVTPVVRPLCRFLMVRLVHTQANDLFDRSSTTSRLTTINHQ